MLISKSLFIGHKHVLLIIIVSFYVWVVVNASYLTNVYFRHSEVVQSEDHIQNLPTLLVI